jgi:hypothetical protein
MYAPKRKKGRACVQVQATLNAVQVLGDLECGICCVRWAPGKSWALAEGLSNAPLRKMHDQESIGV